MKRPAALRTVLQRFQAVSVNVSVNDDKLRKIVSSLVWAAPEVLLASAAVVAK